LGYAVFLLSEQCGLFANDLAESLKTPEVVYAYRQHVKEDFGQPGRYQKA